jgi:hypothetical protein
MYACRQSLFLITADMWANKHLNRKHVPQQRRDWTPIVENTKQLDCFIEKQTLYDSQQ